MTQSDAFVDLRRQEFRRYFQPSRLLLGVLPACTPSGVNVIALSFNMYCSYKPPMMAIAVHDINASHSLVKNLDEYVLAVPGEDMAEETMVCGLRSMRDVDKVDLLGLELQPSQNISVPGLRRAIGNIELRHYGSVSCGDHVVVVGEVVRFSVSRSNTRRPLLSVGPITEGYVVLARKGMHRIGVVGASR